MGYGLIKVSSSIFVMMSFLIVLIKPHHKIRYSDEGFIH